MDCPEQVPPKLLFRVAVGVHNGTTTTLSSGCPHPVHLSYQWVDAQDGGMVTFDSRHSRLCPALQPGASRNYDGLVEAPTGPGRYRLQVRVVQECVRWHDVSDGDVRLDCTVNVT
jgi:hypothetical protein